MSGDQTPIGPATGKFIAAKQVIIYEIIAIALIVAAIWLDEIIDFPSMMLGAKLTPVNWQESIFESTLIIMVGGINIYFTKKVFDRMKYLAGTLPVCASCKRIRDENGQWQQIEEYIRDHSAADFSHSICPDCARRLYPEFYHDKSQR